MGPRSISPISRKLQLCIGWPVYISTNQYREPDCAFGMNDANLPTFVGEVNYNRRFTRGQLEAKNQAYLTDTSNQSSDGSDIIRTVMCVDLYFAGTGAKVLETATDLYRSAISIWILRDGTVETVVDWVPLS